MSAKHQAQAVEPSPSMDYRTICDDAWYNVRLRLEGDKLRIMYVIFPEAHDELHSAEEFPDFESIENFRQRFRRDSEQLQDSDCDRVVKGMLVCASQKFSDQDLRFYDAIVESVNPSIHPLQEGQCRCKFELLWMHGPLNGQKTILGIESVCLVPSQGPFFNLVLENFLGIVKEKLISKNIQESTSSSDALNFTQINEPKKYGRISPTTVSPCTDQIHRHPTLHKSKNPRHHLLNSTNMRASEVEKTSKHTAGNPTARGRTSKQSVLGNLEEDVDMGGQLLKKYENFEKKRTLCFCRIDNLEKDISPFTLMQFVQEQLGISCSAFVCPSISHEFFTRGFILIEGTYKAQKLMDFLLKKEYFIVSSRGRPWVIDDACWGITEGVMPYEVKPRNTKVELPAQIKLVHKGTDEYEKVKKMHLLHSKHQEHVNFDLLGRLLAEERTLMYQLNLDEDEDDEIM